ncbi:hypothetical protein GCM10007927_42200 [Sulfitobacter pacificus]|uniref:Uncharacterized protein n=1 Tax=Sulfitobacter pacificus TaxID=1499314 RepID=A0ABQ5VQQ5_9RHOB|nr:hypothetical protein GCM10007927_42200 [Sulfitobacter pacificus]
MIMRGHNGRVSPKNPPRQSMLNISGPQDAALRLIRVKWPSAYLYISKKFSILPKGAFRFDCCAAKGLLFG